eukprot:581338-Hanusia_phi.AAC.14
MAERMTVYRAGSYSIPMIRYQASLVFLLVYTLLNFHHLRNNLAENLVPQTFCNTTAFTSMDEGFKNRTFIVVSYKWKVIPPSFLTPFQSAYHCPPFVIFDPAKGTSGCELNRWIEFCQETFEGLTVDVLNILEPILQAKFKLVINKNDTESIDMALKAVNDGDVSSCEQGGISKPSSRLILPSELFA